MEGFVDFAEESARGFRGGDFDELLADGGGAGGDAVLLEVIFGGAEDGEGVEAAVDEEAFVFCGEDGVDEGLGEVVVEDGGGEALTVWVEEFAEGFAVAG